MSFVRNIYIQWLLLAFSTIFALVFIFYANNSFYQDFLSTITSSTEAIPKAKPQKAFIEIDFGEKKRIFEGTVANQSYPLDTILKSLAKNGDLTFRIRSGRITAIDGVAGPWKTYKNGSVTENPLTKLILSAGDRYVLRLEK